MSTKSSAKARSVRSVAAPSFNLTPRFSALYELAQQSDHLFGSPLGPFYDDEQAHYLPHFVYFGPHAAQDTFRLAVLAGFGSADRAGARALTSFLESLARRPHLGHGLNVSFFPLVNVLGGEGRDLSQENWIRSTAPEIRLLEQDARLRGYQGFVHITSTRESTPAAWVRTTIATQAHRSSVELFTSEDFHPWPVRFEALTAGAIASGPLTLAEDLPFAPFEVELALPETWLPLQTEKLVASLLKRLLTSYRSFYSYGQHL